VGRKALTLFPSYVNFYHEKNDFLQIFLEGFGMGGGLCFFFLSKKYVFIVFRGVVCA
jgi:hypothetical protein